MSPEETCPKCGNKRVFHEEETEGVRAGTIVCTECGLEEQYNEFLGEVLDGQHTDLVKDLEERLAEEGGWSEAGDD